MLDRTRNQIARNRKVASSGSRVEFLCLWRRV